MQKTESRKTVLTSSEAAKMLHVSPRTVAKWIDSGDLRGYRIPGSRHRRVLLSEAVRFAEQHGLPIATDAAHAAN